MIDINNIPNDQQEDENDLEQQVSFRDVVVLSADWTIETIHSQIQKNNINLTPFFQRRNAWDPTRKSRLIESIIVGLPVPNIVLAQDRSTRGHFHVIDGKQRLSTINEFSNNELRLTNLKLRPDLNGMSLNQLPEDDLNAFENATIRSTVIKNWDDDKFLYTAFYRLNSGSLPLSPQELRRALIGGQLLDAIDDYIAHSKPFKQIFGPEPDRRMRDSELVLRFIAFERNLDSYRGNLKDLLDTTTEQFELAWPTTKDTFTETTDRLDKALSLAYKVFNKNAFKKWTTKGYEKAINRAIFDCIARFFADPVVQSHIHGNEIHIAEKFKDLCTNSNFISAIEKTTKSQNATQVRISMWGQALADCLQLRYDIQTRQIH